MQAAFGVERFSPGALPEVDDVLTAAIEGGVEGAVDGYRARVLLVDDEPAITEVLSEYLSIQGFAVTSAESGVEALARLDVDCPDAILLDVRIPGMDGIETLRRIMARGTDARVLMLSANDDVDLAKEAIALGAFDYLLKPVDFGYLSRVLEQMTHRPASGPKVTGLAAALSPPDDEPVSCYDLALEVCRVARDMGQGTKAPVAKPLQRLALCLVRHGPGGERRRLIRYLSDLRTLLRFAKDLGDLGDDVHRRLESQIVRTRRGLGMS